MGFYIEYLTGLCTRRHWPPPAYDCFRTRHGYHCRVRVNNREYSTDTAYASGELARDAAATRAYLICRNFSVNDGMYRHENVVQGLPVAIGTDRRRQSNATSSSRSSTYSTSSQSIDYDSTGSGGLRCPSSGGSSPRSTNGEGGFEAQMMKQKLISASTAAATAGVAGVHPCMCGRGYVRAYGRCQACLREIAWRRGVPRH